MIEGIFFGGVLVAAWMGASEATAATVVEGYELESKVQTRSGLIERYRDAQDERYYQVKLIRREATAETLLEDHPRIQSSLLKTERGPLPPSVMTLIQDEFRRRENEALFLRGPGHEEILGFSKRVFEVNSRCSALARVHLPTPFSRPDYWILSDLLCDDPLTTKSKDRDVVGRFDQNWLSCEGTEKKVCIWNPRHEDPAMTAAAVQLTTYTSLWRADGELLISGIEAFLPPILARSWAFNSNRSLYDAEQRTLFFGSGDFPDGLDAFVVVHEWTHFLIDQLNPGLVGRDAEILHEGLSDFFASNLFGSSCFAPYEAKDYVDRTCVRNLSNNARYPDNMTAASPHESSLILSGAFR